MFNLILFMASIVMIIFIGVLCFSGGLVPTPKAEQLHTKILKKIAEWLTSSDK